MLGTCRWVYLLFCIFINFFQATKMSYTIHLFLKIFWKKGDAGPIDLDKTTTTLEPDKTSSGGLFVPGKERVVFKPSERKSLLGMIDLWFWDFIYFHIWFYIIEILYYFCLWGCSTSQKFDLYMKTSLFFWCCTYLSEQNTHNLTRMTPN